MTVKHVAWGLIPFCISGILTVPSNSIQWSSLQKFQHLQIPPSCDISHEVWHLKYLILPSFLKQNSEHNLTFFWYFSIINIQFPIVLFSYIVLALSAIELLILFAPILNDSRLLYFHSHVTLYFSYHQIVHWYFILLHCMCPPLPVSQFQLADCKES